MEDRQIPSPSGEIESLNERILDEDLDDAAGGCPCATFSGRCAEYCGHCEAYSQVIPDAT